MDSPPPFPCRHFKNMTILRRGGGLARERTSPFTCVYSNQFESCTYYIRYSYTQHERSSDGVIDSSSSRQLSNCEITSPEIKRYIEPQLYMCIHSATRSAWFTFRVFNGVPRVRYTPAYDVISTKRRKKRLFEKAKKYYLQLALDVVYDSSYLWTYTVTTTTYYPAQPKRYKHKSLSQISCPQWISPPTRTSRAIHV